jgi:hypothetical protein
MRNDLFGFEAAIVNPMTQTTSWRVRIGWLTEEGNSLRNERTSPSGTRRRLDSRQSAEEIQLGMVSGRNNLLTAE